MARSLAILVLVLTGCARTAGVPALAGAPAWVREGTGVLEGGEGARLVAVGVASREDGAALAGAAASARARSELTPLIERLITGVVDAYARGGGAPTPALARALHDTAQALVEATGVWEGPDGSVYAGVELRVAALERAVVPAGEVPQALVATLPRVLAATAAGLAREERRRAERPEAGRMERLAPPEPADLAGHTEAEICLARLDGTPAVDEESCVTDDRVARWQGLLRYRCGGGEAEALFGDARFVGTVSGTRVDVRLESEFHFTDGCVWRSVQRIQGALDGEVLQYGYDESPRAGEKDCEEACSTERTLRIQR